MLWVLVTEAHGAASEGCRADAGSAGRKAREIAGATSESLPARSQLRGPLQAKGAIERATAARRSERLSAEPMKMGDSHRLHRAAERAPFDRRSRPLQANGGIEHTTAS